MGSKVDLAGEQDEASSEQNNTALNPNAIAVSSGRVTVSSDAKRTQWANRPASLLDVVVEPPTPPTPLVTSAADAPETTGYRIVDTNSSIRAVPTVSTNSSI